MSHVRLDKEDIQGALDWAFAERKIPNQVQVIEDSADLRVEISEIDLGALVPNFSLEFSGFPSMDGQDLLVRLEGMSPGASLLSAAGGVVHWIVSALGREIEEELYRVESDNTIRIHVGKIQVGSDSLGDLIEVDDVAWIRDRLEVDFTWKK